MTAFVLVHGAYGGGWQPRALARRLRAVGHAAYAVTLTGLGERAHLLAPGFHPSLPARLAERARAQGWAVHALPTGPDAERHDPAAVAAVLLAF